MLKEVIGNVLNYPVIVHQVNCKGVMGAGLAKQIRDRYPKVYYDYKNALNHQGAELGHIVVTHNDNNMVISMFAQDKFGRDRRYTDYYAFNRCLNILANVMASYGDEYTIAFPYNIGCGLAGGDWNVVKPMIERFSEKVKQDVYIVRRS